ncbi:hypothetical protein SNOG_03409 [Parastagonospora nodorum SN15]|uniref:Uncharacterized protein n=1 Tax=Phaeosphaeria nodorum (strain SN15 / ATCC MYA-4574 / FGSC 10173) TaxID=321614 RepID=Q0UXV5_PHANO|nr:hypothetical protein SNOG_03409 [Parastagonospora nodorum SN15]EAT88614.1 hypothetical protein SNOG_03409 [Parastagonospora nodorum SN15]
MANNHQPSVSDPDADMGDSPPSSPRFLPPQPGMSQVPPAYASPYPHPFAPQGDQGQGPPMHPPFTHLPTHIVRQNPYGPLPQSLQPPDRMLPPDHNLCATQGQPGGTYFQGYGQTPTPSASSYHNTPAPHAVEGDDIPWAPGHGEVRRFVAPLTDEQASQLPQAASPYPPASGNPTGGGPQNMGARQPYLPAFTLHNHPPLQALPTLMRTAIQAANLAATHQPAASRPTISSTVEAASTPVIVSAAMAVSPAMDVLTAMVASTA